MRYLASIISILGACGDVHAPVHVDEINVSVQAPPEAAETAAPAPAESPDGAVVAPSRQEAAGDDSDDVGEGDPDTVDGIAPDIWPKRMLLETIRRPGQQLMQVRGGSCHAELEQLVDGYYRATIADDCDGDHWDFSVTFLSLPLGIQHLSFDDGRVIEPNYGGILHLPSKRFSFSYVDRPVRAYEMHHFGFAILD